MAKAPANSGLVRRLLKGFRPGVVMLADALQCNYFLTATLMAAGVDVLFEQNGSRITDLSTWPVAGCARPPRVPAQTCGAPGVDDARAVRGLS